MRFLRHPNGTLIAPKPRMRRAMGVLAVVACVTGCSSHGGDEPTSLPTSDAGPEAAAPSSWMVHVAIQRARGPLPVLTSNPDGTIFALTQTDASGQVDVEVPHLGSVSAFIGFDEAEGDPEVRRVLTYSKVDQAGTFEGEALEFYRGNTLGTLTFYPVGDLPNGTDSVRVALSCGGEFENYGDPASAVFGKSSVCEGMTEFFAVGYALDASGKPLAATVLEHLPAVVGDAVYEIDFDKPAAFELFRPEVSSMPADVTQVYAQTLGRLESGTPRTILKKVAVLEAPITGGIPAMPALTEYFSELEFLVTATRADPSGGPYQPTTSRWLRSSTVPPSFVLDPEELAPIDFVSEVDTSVAGRPLLSYSIAPSGPFGDCVYARVWWLTNGIATIWSDSRKLEASGVFQLPEVPPSLAEFSPSSQSEFQSSTGVGHSLVDSECSRKPSSIVSVGASPRPAPPFP